MNLQPDNITPIYIDLTATLPSLSASLTPHASNYTPSPRRFRSHVAAEYGSKMSLAGISFFILASAIVGYALAMWK